MANSSKRTDLYKDGFFMGLNWPIAWNHQPGGPFVHNEETREEREHWFEGWLTGFQVKILSGRENPKETPEKNRLYHWEKGE